jgi:signal transduction histidine kinase
MKTTSVSDSEKSRALAKRFSGALTPLEIKHRRAIDENMRLCAMNQALNRRTSDLADLSRRLKKEISRREAAEETLRQSELQSRLLSEQLRLLSRRVLSAQEEERKRISRELHDVIAESLTGINVRLANLKREAAASTKGLSQKITRTQRLVEKSVDIVHRFARELRPAALDDLGLIPALHAFLKKFTEETGVRASLTAFAGLEHLSNAKRTVFYRVAQEALANVARHAQASRVAVTIEKRADFVQMSIKDDGKSFEVERMWRDKKNKRLGMLGMRERVQMIGGDFTVESSPGNGTTVRTRIPFKSETKEPHALGNPASLSRCTT